MTNPAAAAGTLGLAERAGHCLLARRWRVVTAESCTGGGVAAALTDVAGSSQWFERGYVTYSNLAKQQALGVRALTLDTQGAVSAATVVEMAAGALEASGAIAAKLPCFAMHRGSAARQRKPHQSHGLGRRSAIRPGHAADGYSQIRATDRQRSGRHLDNRRGADRALGFEGGRLDAQILLLGDI